MAIRGLRKESGRTLEDLAKVICGHWRIWKGQCGPAEDLRRAVGASGGLGKVRGGLGRGAKQLLEDLGSLEDTVLFCFFHWLIECLLCCIVGFWAHFFPALNSGCFSVGYTCHLDWEIICFPGHLASFDSSTKSPNSKTPPFSPNAISWGEETAGGILN